MQRKVLTYSRSQAKEFKGDGLVQCEVLTNLRSKAKEFTGDGEVEREVLTNLQLQAKELKGNGLVQHEVLTNLSLKAKEVNTVGSTSLSRQGGPPRDRVQPGPLQAARVPGEELVAGQGVQGRGRGRGRGAARGADHLEVESQRVHWRRRSVARGAD